MKNILITGALGFIGVNLAHQLLKNEDKQIYGIDNFSTGEMSLAYPLLKNPRFNLIQDDILNPIKVDTSEIYFCAGCGDVTKINDDKYNYCSNHLKLIENILTYTKQTGTKTIFIRDFNFQDEFLNSFENYVQKLILQNKIENKTNLKIVRTSELYGINSSNKDNRLIINSIIKAQNNEQITFENNKEEYFTYIEDFCEAVENVMENYFDEDILNITSKNKYLISDVANFIVKLMNSKSKIAIKSNEIIKKNFDFESIIPCKTSIEIGIQKTIDFAKMMYFS